MRCLLLAAPVRFCGGLASLFSSFFIPLLLAPKSPSCKAKLLESPQKQEIHGTPFVPPCLLFEDGSFHSSWAGGGGRDWNEILSETLVGMMIVVLGHYCLFFFGGGHGVGLVLVLRFLSSSSRRLCFPSSC